MMRVVVSPGCQVNVPLAGVNSPCVASSGSVSKSTETGADDVPRDTDFVTQARPPWCRLREF